MSEDLVSFLHALEENKKLAMNFWGLVGRADATHPDVTASAADPDSAAEAEPKETPNLRVMQARTLEAVVKMLSGRGVAEMIAAGGESQRSVATLASLLAGEDVHSKAAVSDVVGRDAVLPAAPEMAENVIVLEVKQAEPALIPVDHGRRSTDSASRPVLSFSRSQVAIYDEEKLESERLWAAFAAVSRTPEEVGATSEGRAQSGVVTMRWVGSESKGPERVKSGNGLSGFGKARVPDADLRKTLFELPDAESEDDSEAAQKAAQAKLRKEKLRSGVQMVGSVLLLAAVMTILFHIHQLGGFQRLGDSIHEFVDEIGRAGDAQAESDAGDSVAQKSATHGKNRGSPGGGARKTQSSGRYQSATKAHSAAPPGKGGATTATAQAGLDRPAEGGGVEDMGVSIRNATDNPVPVAADVMRANLISSAALPYATVAPVGEVEGRVVMQALISKNGVVEDLVVVEGDLALRAAAARTVSTWHYKPYLVNGEPVAVKTSVTVYFKIDQ